MFVVTKRFYFPCRFPLVRGVAILCPCFVLQCEKHVVYTCSDEVCASLKSFLCKEQADLIKHT